VKVYIRGHRVGEGFVGKLIGWFTWGRYKHVSMAFVQDDGTVRGFQSNSKHGVHFFMWEDLPDTDLFEVPCTDEQAYAMLDAAKKIVGAGYDYKGLWSFLVRKKRDHPDKWFCSEAAAFVVHAGGVILQRLPFFKQSPVLVCASVAITPRPGLMLQKHKPE